MAEHFYGARHTVHFSTGATWSLFNALIKIAENAPSPSEEHAHVVAFLNSRLMPRIEGGNGFSLHPPPKELQSPKKLIALAKLVGAFAHELARPDPDERLTDINWDRDQRLDWLARMCDLHALIIEALPPEAKTQPMNLRLSPADDLRCTLERRLSRKGELVRRTRSRKEPRGHIRLADSSETIPLLEDICSLVESSDIPEPRRSYLLCEQHSDLAEIFVEQKDTERAVACLKTAAEFSDDEECRQAILEYAASFESD
ncbi:hypothetical protein ACFL6C_06735 [Myxococcota bacterium]